MRAPGALRGGIVALAAAALAGCGSKQSTLRPESNAARDIEQLWWILLAISAVVFAVVLALLVVGVLRARGERPPEHGDPLFGRALIVVGGVAVPLVVLVALFVLTLRTLPSTSPASSTARLTVEVVGHQWFWEVRYPGRNAVTANEIHLPARTPVELRARSEDVIHSFWVPRLNRKIDLIPGQTNSLVLNADEPGVYRGQCAEFCGLQHANMAFLVIVQEPSAFDRWLANEARPARRPTGAATAGARVFLDAGCGACHAVRGTEADGRVGPDLTHLAGRRTLAADTIPNERGHLAGWILDPQHVKPGNKMPGIDVADGLEPLLDYLESLR